MKKSLMLIILLLLALVGCNKNTGKTFNPDDNLDLDNIFFEDFTNGIDINVWEIAHTKWGTTNNGVIYQNVNYTADGILVLQANGDNYAGEFKGYNSNSGQRTGAALVTNEAFGPGRFEVKMKALPRFGATSAFWTFYYDHALGLNHEIDIELNVGNDFRNIWTTNWLTLNDSDHREFTTDIVNNDGQWHIYKFEWHTNPERIDYYVDDILLHTSYTNIPTYAGRLWIGHWFPDAWAGTPDFETDYMFVDWIRYTPYLNNPYVKTEGGRSNFPNHYPTEPIELPLNNLVSNPSFEGIKEAWRIDQNSKVEIIDNVGISNSKAIFVPRNDIAYQYITGLDETFEITLIANALIPTGSEGGYILIECRPLETNLIKAFTLPFSIDDKEYKEDEYFEKRITIKLPKDTKRIELSLVGGEKGGIYFDDLFLNLSSKVK